MASSGCGPTALAMIVSTLTGNTVYPYAVAEFAVANGLRSYNLGTYNTAPGVVATAHGLNYQVINRNQIRGSLNSHSLVYVGVTGAPFTSPTGGHIVVISGVQTRNGVQYYSIFDPNFSNYLARGVFNHNAIVVVGNGQILMRADALDRLVNFVAVISRD